MWLQGKGKLKKEDQQYREWLRADMVRHTRKSVAVISGASRSQAPWWRKQTGMLKKPSNLAENSASAQRQYVNGSGLATAESEENLVEVDSLNVRKHLKQSMGCFGRSHDSNGQWTTDQTKKREPARDLEHEVVNLKIADGEFSFNYKDEFGSHSSPHDNTTNVSNNEPTFTPTTKRWKRVERVNDPAASAPF